MSYCAFTRIFNCSVPHGTLVDTTISGYFIPKNTHIFPNLSAVMKDPNIFPNPEVFCPERYLEKEKDGSIVFKPNPR